jgi:RNA 2',3'-cyclic 3'-phosphodiesterase
VRLFVALSPPPEARQHLAAALASVRTDNDGLRWVEPAAWHLTLAFLGQVEESALPPLTERLGRAARRHSVLHLAFTGAGAFGSRRRARLLWVGVRGDREPLRRLAGSVDAAARRAGIATEDRPYRPHLTLARTRVPMDLTASVDVLAGYEGPTWAATSVHLVRSHLGRHTTHETIGSWDLGPSQRT